MFEETESPVDEEIEDHAKYIYETTALTQRQSEVYALRRIGRDPEEIADTLGTSTDMVQMYLSATRVKLYRKEWGKYLLVERVVSQVIEFAKKVIRKEAR